MEDGGEEESSEMAARYKGWKRNLAVLYDFILHHGLAWASLTCAFGQHLPSEDRSVESKQTLYFSR